MLEARDVRIRVSRREYAIIRTKAQLAGYTTLSSYIRDRVIKVSPKTEQYLKEIYTVIKNNGTHKRH